ncbi:Ribonuclease h domain [Thalictrum thalictroides]|uniref:Ribonuclease h domain n=1 Tax=Thalictrum thalictroides TaxID=46969 RepID=A0A7J6UXN2_THATH|nr:Ribonuclease h domain [Thalictrum thalictroides]
MEPARQAAGGGILRNANGQHIANFFSFYGEGTNNVAETRALLDGLDMCQDLCIDKIQIRTDSTLVVKWFLNLIEVPWHLRTWWRKIQIQARFLDIKMVHVYREGNSLADYLSKQGDSTCMQWNN